METSEELCVRCNKNKRARRNMCAHCGTLDKREQEEKNGIFRCDYTKCKNIVLKSGMDCDKCMEYPKQFLVEENYGKKPCVKSPDKKCINKNCYCCKDGECEKIQTIGTKYCKNCYIKTERENQGLRTCSNIERCKNIITDNEYIRCEKCRCSEREHDYKRRTEAKNSVTEFGYKICTVCCKKKSDDEFIGLKNQVVLQCLKCRGINKKADDKRANRDRLEYERKPEIRETRKKYRENHREKLLLFNQQWRTKQKLENKIEYLKKMAEQMYRWRMNNPEKQFLIIDKHKKTPEYKYRYYKNSSESKKFDFDLSLEDFEDIIFEKCVYCGYYNESYFNGIDRLDSNIGYINSNCVPCCILCNMIKNNMSVEMFLKKIEHILTNLKIINGKLYPDMFFNYYSMSYNKYKSRANEKNIYFNMSIDEYNNIIVGDCYLCGKKTNTYHINGIDRANNDPNIGYIISNCSPCCADCNYMKRDYEYEKFINHLTSIYNHLISTDDNKNSEYNYDDSNIIEYFNSNDEEYDEYLTKIKKYSRMATDKISVLQKFVGGNMSVLQKSVDGIINNTLNEINDNQNENISHNEQDNIKICYNVYYV